MAMRNFPYVALFLGMMFMLVVVFGGQVNEATKSTRLPLLTLLIVCEFAFFLTAIGAFVSIKQILSQGVSVKMVIVALLCALSAITFMTKGISFWPS